MTKVLAIEKGKGIRFTHLSLSPLWDKDWVYRKRKAKEQRKEEWFGLHCIALEKNSNAHRWSAVSMKAMWTQRKKIFVPTTEVDEYKDVLISYNLKCFQKLTSCPWRLSWLLWNEHEVTTMNIFQEKILNFILIVTEMLKDKNSVMKETKTRNLVFEI